MARRKLLAATALVGALLLTVAAVRTPAPFRAPLRSRPAVSPDSASQVPQPTGFWASGVTRDDPVPATARIEPSEEIWNDADRLSDWLFALPDDEFRRLIGTPTLHRWIARVVELISTREGGRATQDAILDNFVTQINLRIRVLKGSN